MLDESLCGEVDAERAVAARLVRPVQPAAVEVRRFHSDACGWPSSPKRHGLGYQLGCQVGETAILSAAGRHFATSVSGSALPGGKFRPPPGLGAAVARGHHLLRSRRPRPGADRLRHGHHDRPGPPGLGHGAEGEADWVNSTASAPPTAIASTTAASRRRARPRASPTRLPSRHPESRRLVRAIVSRVRGGGVRGLLSRPSRRRAEHALIAAMHRASAGCSTTSPSSSRSLRARTRLAADLPLRHLLGR